jgi:hypothetical protein
MNIYVATHKRYIFPKDNETYIPIEVGSSLRSEHFCIIRDNIGDNNISYKNKSYCELSAIYWMLNNNSSEHVGLVHYRRYFRLGVTREGRLLGKWNPNSAATRSELCKILSKYNIIVPRKVKFNETIENDYKKNHVYSDYKKVREIIFEKSPNFIKYFDVFSSQHHIHTCNMFVMSAKYFELCWNWIFSIIFALEKNIDISSYDDYQMRVFGFISERLFNVWVLYAVDVLKLQVYESGVINLEAKSKLEKYFKE